MEFIAIIIVGIALTVTGVIDPKTKSSQEVTEITKPEEKTPVVQESKQEPSPEPVPEP